MFSLSVIDHLRINFNLVAQNYTAHAQAAERLAGFAFKVKIATLALFAFAIGSIALTLVRPAREFQIAAAVIAAVAFAVQVVTVAYHVEARVYSHRLLAHRLWLMCERYRSLLAEIHDGLVDNAAILHRREILNEEVHTIYEQGFPVDQQAYESMRQLPLESTVEPMTETELDHVAPVARKAS